jgi:hypothetical protein
MLHVIIHLMHAHVATHVALMAVAKHVKYLRLQVGPQLSRIMLLCTSASNVADTILRMMRSWVLHTLTLNATAVTHACCMAVQQPTASWRIDNLVHARPKGGLHAACWRGSVDSRTSAVPQGPNKDTHTTGGTLRH